MTVRCPVCWLWGFLNTSHCWVSSEPFLTSWYQRCTGLTFSTVHLFSACGKCGVTGGAIPLWRSALSLWMSFGIDTGEIPTQNDTHGSRACVISMRRLAWPLVDYGTGGHCRLANSWTEEYQKDLGLQQTFSRDQCCFLGLGGLIIRSWDNQPANLVHLLTRYCRHPVLKDIWRNLWFRQDHEWGRGKREGWHLLGVLCQSALPTNESRLYLAGFNIN